MPHSKRGDNPLEQTASAEPTLSPAQEKLMTELSNRLRSICQNISGDRSMRVDVGQPGGGFYWDPKKNEVRFDPAEVLKKGDHAENVLKGIIAHEAGHRVITRYFDFVPKSVLQETGFQSLMASMEERPTDQVVRDRYAGAGEWVDEARRSNVTEATMDESARKKLGYIPQFQQLCNLIVHAPHMEEAHTANYNQDVRNYYEQVRPIVEDIEHQLPHEGANEAEILRLAKERYRKTYKILWPKVQEFVKEDLQKEATRQMLSDMLNDVRSTPDALTSLLEELRQMIDESNEQETPTNEGSTPIPMDDLSPEQFRAAQEALDSLSPSEKELLAKRAKKSLEKTEDSIVKDTIAKLIEDPPETHENQDRRAEEKRANKARQERKQRDQEETKKEIENIERRLAAVQSTAEIYEQAYQEVREIDEALYQRLEEIFHPSIKKKTHLVSSGSRLNLPAVYRWEAARGAGSRSLDTRIFEKIHLPEKRDFAVTLLIDLSGSMEGMGKIEETFKGTVLLTEVLNRLGIKIEILGFQDRLIHFKDFNETMTNLTRKKMSGMIEETRGINPGGNNTPSYNDDGPCLNEASLRLAKQSAKEKLLFIFSDGMPCGHYSTEEDLVDVVHRITTTTDQKLIAFGLGTNTGHVTRYYPASLPNINVRQIPEVFGALLEDVIRNPKKYQSSST